MLAIAKKRGKMVKTFGQGLGTRAGGGAVLDAQLDGAIVSELAEAEVGIAAEGRARELAAQIVDALSAAGAR
jgi:hypothetical protein